MICKKVVKTMLASCLIAAASLCVPNAACAEGQRTVWVIDTMRGTENRDLRSGSSWCKYENQFQYNGSGLITKKSSSGVMNNVPFPLTEEIFEYDSNMNACRKSDGLTELNFVRNGSKQIVQGVEKVDGQEREVWNIAYDGKGNICRIDEPYSRGTRKIESRGGLMMRSSRGGGSETLYQYDERGFLTGFTSYRKNRNGKRFAYDEAKYKNTYDGNGNLTRIKYTDTLTTESEGVWSKIKVTHSFTYKQISIPENMYERVAIQQRNYINGMIVFDGTIHDANYFLWLSMV